MSERTPVVDLEAPMQLLLQAGAKHKELEHELWKETQQPRHINLHGLPYVRTAGFEPRRDIEPPLLTLSTLHSLADYINALSANADYADVEVNVLDFTMVHVVSPTLVYFQSEIIGPWKQRHIYAEVRPDLPRITLNQFLDAEEFNIQLQACFLDTDARGRLLQAAGSIVRDSTVNLLDDGVTQEVQQRQGINKKDWGELPNFIELQPYRTFHEVEQPASHFVFRINGNSLQPALFEADGGAWRQVAKQRVKSWLVDHLPDGFKVLA